MNKQQPDFNNYDSMAYAMAVHDIESLFQHIGDWNAEPGFLEINDYLINDGWILLFIGQTSAGEQVFILGVPRPRFCEHGGHGLIGKPSPSQMIWYHEKKQWNCLFCDEYFARNEHKKHRLSKQQRIQFIDDMHSHYHEHYQRGISREPECLMCHLVNQWGRHERVPPEWKPPRKDGRPDEDKIDEYIKGLRS